MQDSDVEADIESALMTHIRHLLLNYVVQHITADYIQLTEQAVHDLWAQYFVQIPTTDPNSLIIPTGPFDTLTRIHALSSLEPFQEKFQSTPDAIQHIKKLIKPQAGKPKSDRVAFHECSSESWDPVCRPFSPVLTTRAIRETPRSKLVPPKFIDFLSPSHQEFICSQGIAPIGIEPVLETLVKQDEVLNTNWGLRPDDHDAVRSLLRSVLTGPPKGYKNRHLDFASRPDSPPIPSRMPEPQFIPIFPRRRRTGSGVREGDRPPSGLAGIASLPAVILPPVKVEELEPDLHQRNMVIVDGWQAYRSSPSPTPSPASSQEDQLDELFMESPDTTPPPVRPTKMEVVQIPRVKRIGGDKKKPLPIGHGTELFDHLARDLACADVNNSLGAFLLPYVQKTSTVNPPSRLSPEPSVSMVGQADSACESNLDIDRNDPDAEVAGLYGHQKQDPRDLILKEKLDDKRQLLMEVPVLSPPNEHAPNAMFLPASLGDLVAPLRIKGQPNVSHPTHKFLKKAKGIPSLNVELSWVPITAKTRIPKNSEIIRVTSLFDTDPASTDPSMQIAALLAKVPAILSASKLPAHADTWSRRYHSNMCLEVEDPDPDISRCEIILSRKERRRVAGLLDEVQDEDMEDTYDVVDPEDPPVDDRSIKRPRLSQDEYFDDSGVAFDAPPDLDRGSPAFYGDAESFLYDGDKENLPPSHDDPYYDDSALGFSAAAGRNEQFDAYNPATAFAAESQTSQGDLEMTFVNEPREFVALSFESVPTVSVRPTQLAPDETPSDDAYTSMFEPHPDAIVNDSKITKTFLPFCPSSRHRQSIPENIYDRNTLRLPSPWNPPESLHRYMVSMDLVQKQGIVRCLRSRSCSIDLVERDSLGGVDIILDPHTAIIFTNLLILPSECADLANRIAQQSWLYSRLLVIFDAYPASYSYRTKGAWEAEAGFGDIGGLRDEKARVCGARQMMTRGGVIWGDRAWLDDDVPEGEQDLAAADGMNRFAAYLILCQIDLGEFLELSPEARMEKFGAFVGTERMVRRRFLFSSLEMLMNKFDPPMQILLNQVIERRIQAMQPSDSELEPSSTFFLSPNCSFNTFCREDMSKDETQTPGDWQPPSLEMFEFQQLLRSSKNIIAVCGAGLSAASGIPTFRGAGGMWRKYDAMSLATPEAFAEDPSLVWQFYHYRREKARAAEPNAAHKALALFSIPAHRKTVAPNAEFTIITQNVDGLSTKAMDAVLKQESGKPPGISPLLEMHGRIFDVNCTSRFCKHVEYNTSSPICAALAGTEDAVEAGSIDANIHKEKLPRCSKCQALARPGVVWFGEMPKHLDEIDKLVEAADLCLVVGTSSTVYPAAGYASIVKENGGKVAVFNLERSQGDGEADFLFLGPCEKTLPEALGLPRSN
ncbi:hypothetical protein MVEN_01050400 [Mycena venus]|uniref:NAD-dependent protein deacylase n=1 Tax=Mycena venus TaxID=2733690 RepID=A0A8H6Y7K9_9AGAR|nr:hypothetical protein MVEN_01050400 [Mycena venus]